MVYFEKTKKYLVSITYFSFILDKQHYSMRKKVYWISSKEDRRQFYAFSIIIHDTEKKYFEFQTNHKMQKIRITE